ncbi:MAG: NTP transferase domain-containing protein [Armatimonadetes bacterium]|nr:NTP transferase domain-containing protein [Armatimonadota bacterium]
MQAVLLAGGLGTRLRPLTYEIPKVLVPVAGRPFVDWLLDALPRDVFDEVLLLTGYLGEQVEEYCGKGERYDLRINYSREPEPMGTAGALRHAAAALAERFVLINADTYVRLDYADLLAQHSTHVAAGAIGTMVVGEPYGGGASPNVRLQADGLILAYAKHAEAPGLNGVDAGVIVFERRVLDYVPERRPVGLEEGVFQQLSADGLLAGYRAAEPFYDMGTPEGRDALADYLKSLAGSSGRGDC